MKTAWIFTGGAARAVYTAGVVYALSESDLPKPEIIISCSGSIGTSLCYAAGQKEIIKNVWCKLLSTKRFLSFWRFWKILNISYLVDEILKKENPLDMERIRNSSIQMYFPLTKAETGEIVYFSNKDEVDLYEVMRAGCSIPLWTNLLSLKGIPIKRDYYADSGPAGRYQVHIQKALGLGAERIMVFDNWHQADNSKPFFFSKKFTSLRNSEYRKHQLAYYEQIEHFVAPQGIELKVFEPKSKLVMSRWNIDNANANKIFAQGYQELKANLELENSGK